MAGHGHSHGSCAEGHDDGDHIKEDDRGALFSLYLKIDTHRLQCLNEVTDGSGKTVFKPWDRRKDKTEFVQSDSDEELLFNIPFTGDVKLKGIIIIGGEGDTHPDTVKLFKNRPGMTFDDASCEADQVFELHPDKEGDLEYATKIARFSSVNHLSLHFPSNFGAESTKIYYIGLRGDFTASHRHEVTICTYEANANPADHKANLFDSVNHAIH